MYRKEVNERSPMRVFEKSMHGGLGRGNVGVVAAKTGVGKTPLLVQIALDDLMRDRRVLHISHEHAVDHVREGRLRAVVLRLPSQPRLPSRLGPLSGPPEKRSCR